MHRSTSSFTKPALPSLASLTSTILLPFLKPHTTTSLRYPNRAELRDLTTAEHVDDLPEVQALGYYAPNQGFLGRTRHGRLVFDAPHIHGVSMHIPDASHPFSEYLTAIHSGSEGERGHLSHHGWSDATGFGPHDTLRNIALKIDDEGSYFVKDNVPLNRMVVNKNFPRHEEDNGAIQLGPDVPTRVLKVYPNQNVRFG